MYHTLLTIPFSFFQPSADPSPVAGRPLSQPAAPPRRHTYTHPPAWTPDPEDEPTDGVTAGDTSLPEVFPGDLPGGAGEPAPLTRSRSDPKMDDSVAAATGGAQRAVLESVPATYRSVRSMKHRDRAYQEGMRKSNSMHDLSRPPADPPPATGSGGVGAGLYRSRSRDALYASPSVSDPLSNHSAPASPNHKPKTFFESLHESLLNPPEPPTKNSRYLRMASIPSTRTIEDYVGTSTDPHDGEPLEPSPRRAKSLERPPSVRRRRPTSPSPVSTTRQPLRSQSSPRSAPRSPNTSPTSSHIQHLREKFQSLAQSSPRVPAPTSSAGTSPAGSLPRSASGSSCSSSRFADVSGSETDAAKSAAGGGAGGRASRVTALSQQWSNHGEDSTTRTGRSRETRHSTRNSQHAPAGPNSPVRKFDVRVPPPYRTASLTSAVSHPVPRTHFIGQEAAAASRPLAPRSTSAPSPARTTTHPETPRSGGRGHEAYSPRDPRDPRDPRTPPYIVNGRTKNETDEHKVSLLPGLVLLLLAFQVSILREARHFHISLICVLLMLSREKTFACHHHESFSYCHCYNLLAR